MSLAAGSLLPPAARVAAVNAAYSLSLSLLGRYLDPVFYSRVTEPRKLSPSASRSHSSYSFVAFDGLSGLATTRSDEPHHHICTRDSSRVRPSDSEIGGLGPKCPVCRGRKS